MSDDAPAHVAEHRTWSRRGWYAVQVAIVAAVTVGGFEGSGRQFSIGTCFLVGLGFALVVTVFGTATADWFRHRPTREKVFWAAMVVAMTAAGGALFIFLNFERAQAGAALWVPFVLVLPLALFVWLVIGVLGLFRRTPQRHLPFVEQQRGGTLPIGQRASADKPRE